MTEYGQKKLIPSDQAKLSKEKRKKVLERVKKQRKK